MSLRVPVGLPGRALVMGVLVMATIGCGANRYASPSAARPSDGPNANRAEARPSAPQPVAALAVFRNRAVTIRVLDNRRDRPQSAVLIDEVVSTLTRTLEHAKVGAGPDAPAVLEVRILRYAAEGELSKWRACVGFGATVEIAPGRRHDLGTERCATVPNVWGTDSADEALRAAFREAVRDLVAQLDGLPALTASP